MTPKEKAQELVQKFNLKPISPIFIMSDEHIKTCALIAIDEILEIMYNSEISIQELFYWRDVKHEIEKL